RGCQLLCLARTSHERRSMLRFTCDAFKTSVRSFAHCAGDKDPDRTRTAATREGAMLDLKFFVVFFVVVDPIALIPLFSRLTQGASVAYQRRMAAKAVVVAAGILLLFALGGAGFLKIMGISLEAFRIFGGLLLFLLALEMVFARESGTRTSSDEQAESRRRADISVFPLAFPFIAGPGALATILLWFGPINIADQTLLFLGLSAGVALVLVISLGVMWLAD